MMIINAPEDTPILYKMFTRWAGVVPTDVAKKQVAWERAQMIIGMRKWKMPYHIIGKRISISHDRVRRIYLRALHEMCRGMPP
jgi:hypothetical protein